MKSKTKDRTRRTVKIRLTCRILLLLCVLWASVWGMYSMVSAEGQENVDKEQDEKLEIEWGDAKDIESEVDNGEGELNENKEEDEEESEEGKENMDAEEEGAGDNAGEENEIFVEPDILYPAADGKWNYYITRPEVKIIHKEKKAITKYELIAGDGKKKMGSLEPVLESQETVLILKEELTEGENILKVWMEKPEAFSFSAEETNRVVYEEEVHFWIDTVKPEKVQFIYNRTSEGNILFSNEPFELTVKSSDDGSGIEALYYKTSSGESGGLHGTDGKVVLNLPFSGYVEAYAVDRAGNQSESVSSRTILCENIPPEIQIRVEGGENTWHQGPVSVHVMVNDPALSSGIRSFRCYCDGQVVVQKYGEIKESNIPSMEAEFVVDTASKRGNGIPVVAEVLDRAGNYRTERSVIYIDCSAPEVRLEGVSDRMITGQTILSKVQISEDNLLLYRSMEIWRTSPEGEKIKLDEKMEHVEGVSEDDLEAWLVHLEEEGIYEVKLIVEDAAGNRTEREYQITIDKTNPIIRYVDQMQGAYLPYFQWNYGADEVIQDFTDYSYEILLDGMYYAAGMKIREEGIRLLQVRAVDAAGNESVAFAVFHIDHTPPGIHIYDVADGERYRDKASLSVAVDGEGEYLREVTVNAEKMKLSADSQIFQQVFEEAGDYTVEITAVDIAGNQAERSISFYVEEKRMSVESLLKPVTKIMKKSPESVNQDMQDNDQDQEDALSTRLIVIFGVIVVLLLFFCLIFCRRLWKKERT